MKILEQMQLQAQRNEESTRALEDRKLLIMKQMSDMENPPAVTTGPDGAVQPKKGTMSYEAQLEEQKKLLADLQSRYTERHPDIVRTKKRIADLEKSKESTSVKNDPRYKELVASLAETDKQIRRQRQEGEKINAQIGQYRGRVESATQREQEMATMVQEYNNTRLQYDTLIKKSEEAQQAENLERRQKGEQFRVIDPARMPEKPVQPDIPKVLLIGLFAGLGCGLGGIFIREQLDRSFRDPEDAEVTLGLKVLANIPRIGSKAA
jgi:uncharacterized protein involved in exopolysaccharide biosynthesis